MKKVILFCSIALSFLLAACSGSNSGIAKAEIGVNNEKMTIASQQRDCMGVAPQKCLLVKTGDQQTWSFFYSGIKGFEYEPGYEYVLEVETQAIERPAADQSSVRYVLVKVISKEKKESSNLPA